MSELPQVGQTYSGNGETVTVSAIQKRGRGYQVLWATPHREGKSRLKDFNRQYKPLGAE